MDQNVIQTLTGNTNSIIKNEKDLKSKRPQSYTALISNVNKIYNLFPGSVLYYGVYKGTGTVNIAVSNHEVLRYLYLSEIANWPGADLQTGELIGTAGNQHTLGLEYCTQWRGESKYPVRILGRTYYKQNPKDILDGLYSPIKEMNIKYGINRPQDTTKLTEEQLAEWGNPYLKR